MAFANLKKTLETLCPTLVLKENQPLSAYTTFKIGGNCPLMAFPSSTEEVIHCLTQGQAYHVPCIPLGNGSNLLVADEGVSAFFIHTKELKGISLLEEHKIQVESGVLLGKLANFVAKHQLSGLEFAQGIPGSVGGALVMNAGAYGGEMCQVVLSVTSYSLKTGEIITRTCEELEFSYRHSLFSCQEEMILSAVLQLQPEEEAVILQRMKDFSIQRREKQPLDLPSCGSTFKRPSGNYAAALIDQCGLKGLTHGGAQVSPKHAGFVVNVGQATCQDVISLTDEIKKRVLQETGISLALEVQILSSKKEIESE